MSCAWCGAIPVPRQRKWDMDDNLRLDGFRVCQFDDADEDGIEFRDSGGPQTLRSGYDFVLALL